MVQGGTKLKSDALGGTCVMRSFTLKVIATSTQQKNFEKFFDYYQTMGESEKYLVIQWASTTFREFTYNATNYKYTPVILTGYQIVENVADSGKDNQAITIEMYQANRAT